MGTIINYPLITLSENFEDFCFFFCRGRIDILVVARVIPSKRNTCNNSQEHSHVVYRGDRALCQLLLSFIRTSMVEEGAGEGVGR